MVFAAYMLAGCGSEKRRCPRAWTSPSSEWEDEDDEDEDEEEEEGAAAPSLVESAILCVPVCSVLKGRGWKDQARGKVLWRWGMGEKWVHAPIRVSHTSFPLSSFPNG